MTNPGRMMALRSRQRLFTPLGGRAQYSCSSAETQGSDCAELPDAWRGDSGQDRRLMGGGGESESGPGYLACLAAWLSSQSSIDLFPSTQASSHCSYPRSARANPRILIVHGRVNA